MNRSAAAVEAAAVFMRVLRATAPAMAQSRLLNTKDRDLAVVLSVLEEEERSEVFARVSPAKTARLRGEVEHMRHVHLDAETIERIAAHLAEHISGERALSSASRYFRPRRDER